MCLMDYNNVNYKKRVAYKVMTRNSDGDLTPLFRCSSGIVFKKGHRIHGVDSSDEYGGAYSEFHCDRICTYKNEKDAICLSRHLWLSTEVWKVNAFDIHFEGRNSISDYDVSYLSKSIELIKKVTQHEYN